MKGNLRIYVEPIDDRLGWSDFAILAPSIGLFWLLNRWTATVAPFVIDAEASGRLIVGALVIGFAWLVTASQLKSRGGKVAAAIAVVLSTEVIGSQVSLPVFASNGLLFAGCCLYFSPSISNDKLTSFSAGVTSMLAFLFHPPSAVVAAAVASVALYFRVHVWPFDEEQRRLLKSLAFMFAGMGIAFVAWWPGREVIEQFRSQPQFRIDGHFETWLVVGTIMTVMLMLLRFESDEDCFQVFAIPLAMLTASISILVSGIPLAQFDLFFWACVIVFGFTVGFDRLTEQWDRLQLPRWRLHAIGIVLLLALCARPALFSYDTLHDRNSKPIANSWKSELKPTKRMVSSPSTNQFELP